jgi:kinesin family protein 3/17
MMGNLESARVSDQGEVDLPEDAGIMPRSFAHLFSAVNSLQTRSHGARYLIRCSFIEIFNEELRDLLAVETRDSSSSLPGAKKKKLEIKETESQSVYVRDCIVRMARTPKDLLNALKDGVKSRAVGDTQMNRESSRSHCIFTVYIEMQEELKVAILSLRINFIGRASPV